MGAAGRPSARLGGGEPGAPAPLLPVSLGTSQTRPVRHPRQAPWDSSAVPPETAEVGSAPSSPDGPSDIGTAAPPVYHTTPFSALCRLSASRGRLPEEQAGVQESSCSKSSFFLSESHLVVPVRGRQRAWTFGTSCLGANLRPATSRSEPPGVTALGPVRTVDRPWDLPRGALVRMKPWQNRALLFTSNIKYKGVLG